MVYLIHLDKPFKHCTHYIGYVDNNLEARLKRHKNGTGAKLLKAVNNAGITYSVVRIWDKADRNFERSLKNYKKASHFCPICNRGALKYGIWKEPVTEEDIKDIGF